jgi:hypothetical protein
MVAIAWERLQEEVIRRGYRSVAKRMFRLPDGTVADVEITCEGPTACVVAVTGAGGIILARHCCPAPDAVLLELPGGGGIETGETPRAATQRAASRRPDTEVTSMTLPPLSWRRFHARLARRVRSHV